MDDTDVETAEPVDDGPEVIEEGCELPDAAS